MALHKAVHAGQLTDTYAATAIGLEDIGTKRFGINGEEYVFVKAVDIDLAIGMSVCASSTAKWNATADRHGGTALGLITSATVYDLPIVGVALGTVDISEKPYCWIQTKGYCASILTDTNAVAGSRLVAGYAADATKDGIAVLATRETDGDPLSNVHDSFALCDAADAAAVGTGYLNCYPF